MTLEEVQNNPDGEHTCPICFKIVPNIRAVLVNVLACKDCTPQKERPLGVNEYGHKTAGFLVICESRAEFEDMKKTANKRR